MIVVYGIPNCDTVKKARVWLTEQGLAHTFHDFKRQGAPIDKLTAWASAVGGDKLLNRQGTTWRKLDAATQASVVDAPTAQAVMRAHASTVKRPVVEWDDGHLTVGFTPARFEERLP